MERMASEIDIKVSPRRRASAPGKARDERSHPRSRSVNRSARAHEFAAFSGDVLRDLDPRGPLESLMAEHVVQAAWRLREAIDRRALPGPRSGSDPDGDGKARKKTPAPTADRAARSVRDAIESLHHLRDRRPVGGGSAPASAPAVAPKSRPGPEIEPNEWPIVPSADCEGWGADPGPRETFAPDWRDRLVFDFDVSDISPVVKGTWITVSHVVSLIVDGWTWADILRAHPELTEEDVRTCLAYAVAQEGEEA